MNGPRIDSGAGNRRRLVRAILAVTYAAVLVLAFMLGKGHTLLLDNKDSEDGALKAIESLTLSVDGGEPMEFLSGDRDMVKVRSQWHRIVISVNGRETERKVTLPVGQEMLILSLPRLLAGAEPFVTPFVPKNEPPAAGDPAGGESIPTPPPTAAP